MITTEGVTEAAAFLRAVASGVWRQPVGEAFGRELVAKTKPYVSKPPQSKYVRTGNLSRQWYSTANTSEVVIGNRAPYSGWVQQRETQAWMHRQHGWHTVEDKFESQYMSLYLKRAVEAEMIRMKARYG